MPIAFTDGVQPSRSALGHEYAFRPIQQNVGKGDSR